MAQINKPSLHFNTNLYTGNDADNRGITGIGFRPDWVWIKKRNATAGGVINDVVRGAGKVIYVSESNAEATETASFVSFDSDGYTISQDAGVGLNVNNDTYVGWNWKAGNSQGSSNTDGSINTTYTSVNTTAGFSISKYTGTGANATIGHGLGVAPKMIIFKNTNSTRDWNVYHASIQPGTPNAYLTLNQNYAKEAGYNFSNATAPTTSVFSVGNMNGNNGSGQEYIAYCFADVKGYSKFGGFTGNGNADGPFIYTGFKPAFFLMKEVTDTGTNWVMYDNKRNTGNAVDKVIYPNLTNAEGTGLDFDFLSNGIKCRNNNGGINGNTNTYIYMAFAESALVGTNNIPGVAR